MSEAKELSPLPFLLQQIPDPPKRLYYRGTVPDWDKYKILTVVGSRRYSQYGKTVCEQLIADLAGYPIMIVSGLALGIDQIAHRAALRAGLLTIAFPGSGLNDKVIAPATNYGLAMDILATGGALCSEFEENQKAAPWTFPKRNRLMAGVSDAVLVIEAGEKSGTLITSRLATEYNRDVFAVPGSIFREQAAGPHMLMKLGAYPVTSAKDIVEHFGLEILESDGDVTEEILDLSETEQAIWNLLREPTGKQELLAQLPNSISEINIAISLLEIKGLVQESMGLIRRLR